MAIMKELSHCKHIIGFYGSHEIERDGYLEAYILMELGEKTVYDALVEQ
jgi:serine/threonine protein kinase